MSRSMGGGTSGGESESTWFGAVGGLAPVLGQGRRWEVRRGGSMEEEIGKSLKDKEGE